MIIILHVKKYISKLSLQKIEWELTCQNTFNGVFLYAWSLGTESHSCIFPYKVIASMAKDDEGRLCSFFGEKE